MAEPPPPQCGYRLIGEAGGPYGVEVAYCTAPPQLHAYHPTALLWTDPHQAIAMARSHLAQLQHVADCSFIRSA